MKIAKLRITPEFLCHLFFNREIHLRVEDGLPDDAKFYTARYNYRTQEFELYFESEEFEDIPIPALNIPTFTDIEKNKEKQNERGKK